GHPEASPSQLERLTLRPGLGAREASVAEQHDCARPLAGLVPEAAQRLDQVAGAALPEPLLGAVGVQGARRALTEAENADSGVGEALLDGVHRLERCLAPGLLAVSEVQTAGVVQEHHDARADDAA